MALDVGDLLEFNITLNEVMIHPVGEVLETLELEHDTVKEGVFT